MLEIRNLQAEYTVGESQVVALRDVDLDVPTGTAVALVGESGCGKSTLVLSVLGLITPPIGRVESGNIRLDGVELTELNKAQMRRVLHEAIGYIPQDPTAALDPLCSIGRHVDETLSISVPRARRPAAIASLLESLGIANAAARLRHYPHEFSGGMKQRVAIATALAREPKLLIADEPTTALDVSTQLGILRLIDRLRRERNLSLLYVTHDLSVARLLCQEVLVMYAGTVVEKGPIDEVMGNPRHPYTRALVGAIPRRSAPRTRLRAIPGQPPLLTEILPGCPFAPRCPLADSQCRQQRPKLEVKDGIPVACWHAGETEQS
jgi:peptide/nickel transport system ATP-binding protein